VFVKAYLSHHRAYVSVTTRNCLRTYRVDDTQFNSGVSAERLHEAMRSTTRYRPTSFLQRDERWALVSHMLGLHWHVNGCWGA